MDVKRMIELEKYLKGEIEIGALDDNDATYLYLARKMSIEDVIFYIAYFHSKSAKYDMSQIIDELLVKYNLSKDELGRRFRDVYAIREYKKNIHRQQGLTKKKI